MSWYEFCEKAEDMGATVNSDETVYFKGLMFEEDGYIYKYVSHIYEYVCISSNRTEKQMLAIMEALK